MSRASESEQQVVRRPVSLAVACICSMAIAAACAGTTTPGQAAAPVVAASNIAGLDSAMPAQVGAFTLVARRPVPGAAGDMAYRYRDASPANISVYVYSASYPGVDASGGPRERVAREGLLLLDVMPIQTRRGVYDSFEPLVSRADSLQVGNVVVPGYLTGVRVHRRSVTAQELQFLHLVGGDFVKLRATVPEDYSIATLRSLDSGIVARLVRP